MKKYLIMLLCCGCSMAQAQLPDSTAIAADLNWLAADSLKGRGNETVSLQQAAYYIADAFEKNSLKTIKGLEGYFQPFLLNDIKGNGRLSNGDYDPRVSLNVAGVLPGRSKADEIILFTAHYDHLGIVPTKNGDSIYNGANDNASGTAAMLALARYYAAIGNNERTLVFCAFAGEELGLYGSEQFAKLFKPKHVVAVINIEMIGLPHKSGAGNFFMTGADFSSMRKIVKRRLDSSGVAIVEEPSEAKQLFLRSDNYPFARLGIPAHSFMSSDDEEPCYHKRCDEAARLHTGHMAKLLQAIIKGVEGIVSGSETPSRINSRDVDALIMR